MPMSDTSELPEQMFAERMMPAFVDSVRSELSVISPDEEGRLREFLPQRPFCSQHSGF